FMLFLYQKTFIYQGMNCIFELSSFSNKLKKFNFSSELVEQRINNLKKSLGEFYTLEPEKVDTTIDNYVKDLLDKLKKFEILNKYIVIGLLIFLTLLFIIVFLAK
ncbi:hypothetical protein, partial [Tetragenococcus halophilus]|uniref:hypothetical protein n=1 Tax=Tetragenococcus halophilus TaxID=51669 RepID=UPI0030101D89